MEGFNFDVNALATQIGEGLAIVAGKSTEVLGASAPTIFAWGVRWEIARGVSTLVLWGLTVLLTAFFAIAAWACAKKSEWSALGDIENAAALFFILFSILSLFGLVLCTVVGGVEIPEAIVRIAAPQASLIMDAIAAVK